MSLLEQIRVDQIQARKNRDAERASLLTTLLSEAANVGLNDGKRETTDLEVIAVIKKFIKNIDETLAVRDVEELRTERNILESYLPSQLTEEELTQIVELYIEALVQPRSMKLMGTVMKHLRESYEGQYDGKLASNIVKRALQ